MTTWTIISEIKGGYSPESRFSNMLWFPSDLIHLYKSGRKRCLGSTHYFINRSRMQILPDREKQFQQPQKNSFLLEVLRIQALRRVFKGTEDEDETNLLKFLGRQYSFWRKTVRFSSNPYFRDKTGTSPCMQVLRLWGYSSSATLPSEERPSRWPYLIWDSEASCTNTGVHVLPHENFRSDAQLCLRHGPYTTHSRLEVSFISLLGISPNGIQIGVES